MPGEFWELNVYQQAREFRRRVWKLTRLLPPDEKFVLVPQMRRASLSVTNNIAEGHGSWSYRHIISYMHRSRGSMSELLDDLSLCEDEQYFKKEHLDDLRELAFSVVRLLNGYIAHLKRKASEERSGGDKAPNEEQTE